ncbi:DoxX family protein [Kribbella sp. NPDC056345]|uniref:DoxX family protein n=1 Tax=Kribbella sp. NPDC056345 TaxID=3345789 RepID=UPI0035D97EC0
MNADPLWPRYTLSVIGFVLMAILGSLGAAKVAAVPAMRAAAAHARLGVSAYRLIGVAELAAVAGLLLGRWWRFAGISAAIGILVLMAGATAVHLRNRDSAVRFLPAIATATLTIAYLILLGGVTP